MSEEPPKKKRKQNFTVHEIERLLELIEKDYEVISGKFSDIVTLKKKQEAWQEICRKINATSPCLRTVDEIFKKWEDMKSKVKKKANKEKQVYSKTGNTPRQAADLSNADQRVIDLLGIARMFGIEGGVDTHTADRPND
ncbi:nuclear apoptosis-inducing factor 1-like [Gigantopelta aegis]|uniref:nuclear apoptosis-inducing factor 1-like n=1 Tax=Gigantopelta aegis TaxID=1735272 RepID=UPI001B88C94B|nr:nuclear apoptosis-inducing factor 1-like [Gigantopelta aegis]